ncbi:MAG: rhodanese-like domain-containing protein [Enterococcaceae bacterium]|jgi:rhodanese-related sulfurtransferase|nr:rhodanese-like domain-containing protein [Enterococcaceae bacterium]MCI1920060.1 rhodanese-like domain-containing protein [Enterococcaceae bacterium]
MQEISISEFLAKRKDAALELLDLRTPLEYEAEHLPEARSLPLEELPDELEKLDKATHYYLICRTGRKTRIGGELMEAQGFKVTAVAGGMYALRDYQAAQKKDRDV